MDDEFDFDAEVQDLLDETPGSATGETFRMCCPHCHSEDPFRKRFDGRVWTCKPFYDPFDAGFEYFAIEEDDGEDVPEGSLQCCNCLAVLPEGALVTVVGQKIEVHRHRSPMQP